MGVDGAVLILVLFDKDEITPIRAISEIVGQNGIEAEKWYALDDGGKFVEVKS